MMDVPALLVAVSMPAIVPPTMPGELGANQTRVGSDHAVNGGEETDQASWVAGDEPVVRAATRTL